jgi:addiction module HigA family antidote
MMHNPPHPGEALRELYVQPLNLSVTDLAKELNIARKTLSAILNGHAGISPLMAIKLSIAFDTTPESWLEMQNQYDLWKEKQLIKEPLNIRRLFIAEAHVTPMQVPV